MTGSGLPTRRANLRASRPENTRLSSAQRRLQAATRMRSQLLQVAQAGDRADLMFAAVVALADDVTRRPDFAIPGEWFEGYPWIRACIVRLVGEPKEACARVVLRCGATAVSRRTICWDYDQAFFGFVHTFDPDEVQVRP